MFEVNVIIKDGARTPDYEGSYRVLVDRGSTMIIEPILTPEDLLAEIRSLREQLEAKTQYD